MTTLTIKEIKNLAVFAGLSVNDGGLDSDDMEAEIVLEDCAECGVRMDNGEFQKYTGNVAFFADLPDEGVMPLGEPIGNPVGCSDNPASCERNEGYGCECS